MRKQFNLEESPWGDCLVHCFCEECALCQEYHELKSLGFDVALGVETIQRPVPLQDSGRHEVASLHGTRTTSSIRVSESPNDSGLVVSVQGASVYKNELVHGVHEGPPSDVLSEKHSSDFNASLEIEGVGLGCDMAELSCAMLLNAEGSTCGTSNLLEKRPGNEMLLTLRGKWKRRARQKGIEGSANIAWQHHRVLVRELDALLLKEEKYCQQRSRVSWLRCRDRNTKFFHVRASNRKKRNLIVGYFWEMDRGAEEMEAIITSYFEKIFCSSSPSR
ncbi:hypothetical protein JRO89_XS05G0222700 [Xanthoceras sorbifolium]|uniref:Uncharacterized protein n=1 Tax=Xanthoceras sorbifolium TaxID=99658 RepID=A0ABQ8I2T5_9ROSI|nr:hypothetical protein JRO89_XS05G0222700 [Xanthoceras sorbifolium]